jgi:hypothetical protein
LHRISLALIAWGVETPFWVLVSSPAAVEEVYLIHSSLTVRDLRTWVGLSIQVPWALCCPSPFRLLQAPLQVLDAPNLAQQ